MDEQLTADQLRRESQVQLRVVPIGDLRFTLQDQRAVGRLDGERHAVLERQLPGRGQVPQLRPAIDRNP